MKAIKTIQKEGKQVIRYESPLIGQTFTLEKLREPLAELGFYLNETFSSHFGAFDCVLEKSKSSYDYYLRLTVSTVQGYLDAPHAIVKIEEIYAIGARYHHGFADDLEIPRPLQEKAKAIVDRLSKHLSHNEANATHASPSLSL